MQMLHLRLLLVFAIGVITAQDIKTTTHGCWRDELKPWFRSLPLSYMFTYKMTKQLCVRFCQDSNFKYAGTEYGTECWCGVQLPPANLKIDDSKCDVKCSGDETDKCGGENALSVYENVDSFQPPKDDGRPLLALVMMLKDEAHTIKTTLDSVKSGIDRWYILDTGSKDGTMEVVRKEMQGIEGKLFTGEFTNYGETRNKIINFANETSPRPVFFLMLSADETVTDIKYLRSNLERMRYSQGPMHAAYAVKIDTGGGASSEFETARVGRADMNWRYTGRVHEYWTSPDKKGAELYKPDPPFRIVFKPTDGDRRLEQQKNLLRLIWEDINEAPDAPASARHYMLAATTMEALKNQTGTLWAYGQMARVSTWDEEKFHAMFMQGKTCEELKLDYETKCLDYYLDAHTYMPQRMDAMHAIAEHYYNVNEFQKSYLFALRLQHYTKPDNLELIQNVMLRDSTKLYDYEGMRLLGFAALKVKHYQMCARAFKHVLKATPTDEIAANQLKDCESKMADWEKQELFEELEALEKGETALKSSGSGQETADDTEPAPIIKKVIKKVMVKRKVVKQVEVEEEPILTPENIAAEKKIKFAEAVASKLAKKVQKEEGRLRRERGKRSEGRKKLRDTRLKQPVVSDEKNIATQNIDANNNKEVATKEERDPDHNPKWYFLRVSIMGTIIWCCACLAGGYCALLIFRKYNAWQHFAKKSHRFED